MSSSVKARLIIIVLVATTASLPAPRICARPTRFRRLAIRLNARARCSWRPVASCSIRVA